MPWIDIVPGTSYPEATEITRTQVFLPDTQEPEQKPKRKPKTYPEPTETDPTAEVAEPVA